MARKPAGSPSPREAGLRKLAFGGADRAEALLQHAVVGLNNIGAGTKKVEALRALVQDIMPTFPNQLGAEQRGAAIWRLIQQEARDIAPSDQRTALIAALQLDPTIHGTTIDGRLSFARDRGDFGTRAGKRPGYDALRTWWGEGVRLLGHAIDQRIAAMRENPDQWLSYVPGSDQTQYRTPFSNAQPVFVDLFVATVFMKHRSVQRRITERVVTAQEDDVAYYNAWSLSEATDMTTSVPVQAIWGCRAEPMPSLPGEPGITRLWFPQPLRRGEQHYFSSEALAKPGTSERRAISVEVDSHGIAPGQRINAALPVGGLTIRVRFDEAQLPEAVWWYADVAEHERYLRPSAKDGRLLTVSEQGAVEHTFTEACQPRANYGLAFAWPMHDVPRSDRPTR